MLTLIATAVAEVATAAPQAEEQQLLDLDASVLVTLGLFLLLAVVLSRWLWKPYLRIRTDRTQRVEGYKDQAVRLDKEAADRLAKVQADLAQARREGSVERARSRAEGQSREQVILAQAQAQAERALGLARAQVEAAMVREKATLTTRAQALGRTAAERVLGRRLAP